MLIIDDVISMTCDVICMTYICNPLSSYSHGYNCLLGKVNSLENTDTTNY